MLDIEGLGVQEEIDMTDVDKSDIFKLSDRGISILQGLAAVNGVLELRDEFNSLRMKRINGSIEDLNRSEGIWSKIRNLFAGMFD